MASEGAIVSDVTPPAWAERVLRLVVRHDHYLNVAGDLLEAYRETIYPSRGRGHADRWYTWQVAQFVWLSVRRWSVLFSALFIGRTMLDWLVPPNDFANRAMVTIWMAAAIVAIAALRAAVRCRSVVSGIFAAVACVGLAAPISIAGVAIILAIWHDSTTLAAIRNSGGLAEALTLPILVALPATVIGIFAGVAGATASQLISRNDRPIR